MPEPRPGIDALLPPDMALAAEELGVKKAGLDTLSTLALSVLAGAFIALGAVFSTTVTAGEGAHFGLTRMMGGVVFSVGVILVIVGGAELFTGNTLITMAWASRRVRTRALLRNWSLVFVGNFIGAAATGVLVYLSGVADLGDGAVGANMLRIADNKSKLTFVESFSRGVLGNAMVCLAVWLSFSARSTTDKVVAIMPPIAAFVADGFEHCVANMYYFPIALMLGEWGPAYITVEHLAWGAMARNLLAVTLGNIVGGGILVGAMYWFIYLRGRKQT